jgi:hypothetical protein
MKWDPDKVILSPTDNAVMANPELPGLYDATIDVKLIALRNLSRRILQKYCTVTGQKEN